MTRLGLIAAMLLLTLGLGGCATVDRTADGMDRVVRPLTDGWSFQFGPEQPDPAAWRPVAMPHSWNRIGEYRIGRSDAVDSRQGRGWYRLTIDGARLPAGRRHVLQFDGVGNVADIWVNGAHVGRHAGAFSRFRFDITDRLRPDGANELLVRADNAKPEPGSTTEHVIPLLGDFFIHGGLYREVALMSVPDAHIDLFDFGGPGVYARTLSIDDDRAVLSVTTRVRNMGGARAELRLRLRLIDANGVTAATADRAVTAAAGAVTPVVERMTVARPRLWDGRRDPHLYTLTVELWDGMRRLDRVDEAIGLRTVRIDPDEGLFLNGRHVHVRGVSRHQDWLGKGWALDRADHSTDMAIIAEMGANSVRQAHYQHAEPWFEEADAAGMLVWAELPFVNKVSFGDAPASPELTANARRQLVELIRQNYNHPSVVTWGIGNEVDIDLAFDRLGPRADARPLLAELHALSRAEDPDRPTVIADCCEDTPGDKVDYLPVLAGSSDLMGYNRYYGWYYGAADDLGAHLDALRAKHPAVPLSVSEYGAGGATSQHSDDPTGGPIAFSGRPHPEDFQSWWHERSWAQIAPRRYLWGSWIWNMFDFSSNIRQEGDATDINDKGLVTFDRRVRKDAFYFYKAHWSDEPVVHITQRRDVERAYPTTDIRLYSNADAVALSLEGRPIGTAPCVDRICVLNDVALAPGVNQVEAVAEIAGRRVIDMVEWRAPDAAAGLTINVGDLTRYRGADGVLVGSDNWFDGGTAHRIAGPAAEQLGGAGEPAMRIGYRQGRFGYDIPLPDGDWRVTLLFVEPDEGGERRFDVRANGRVILRGFSPAEAAGGAMRGVERSADVVVSDGRLRLDFGPDAVLSWIRVRPAGR